MQELCCVGGLRAAGIVRSCCLWTLQEGHFSLRRVNSLVKIIAKKKEAVILESPCDHERSEQPSKPVGNKLLRNSDLPSASPMWFNLFLQIRPICQRKQP